MWREHWTELMAAIRDVARTRRSGPRFSYSIELVVRVYFFAVFHQAPLSWACVARHWPRDMRPAGLPSQSTLSRRTRDAAFDEFLEALGRRLQGRPAARWIKRLDGRPVTVKPHSKDPDATWGRGAGQAAKGYKLHAIWSGGCMPEVFEVAPLGVCEREVAKRLIPRLRGEGYLLADRYYNDSTLFDLAAEHHHRFISARVRPDTGLGHCYQSPHRIDCIDLLEPGMARPCRFGRDLLRQRGQIERDFGNLTSFGGGLIEPPAFVRRLSRVRRWVFAKLIINACRIRARQRKKSNAA